MNRPLRTLLTVLAVVLALGASSSPGGDLPMLPPTHPANPLDLQVLGADRLKDQHTVQDDGTISGMLIGTVSHSTSLVRPSRGLLQAARSQDQLL